MAIDTQNKRRSVQGYWLGAGPVPDGTIGEADRAHTAGYFAGLTYGTPPVITFIGAQFARLFHLHHNIPRFS